VPPNPWGAPHSAVGNPYMFTGRQLDEEARLYFYRARHYDPSKGRFLQRDKKKSVRLLPGCKRASTRESLECTDYPEGRENLYEYVGDNPVNMLDPSGEVKWDPAKILNDEPTYSYNGFFALGQHWQVHTDSNTEVTAWRTVEVQTPQGQL